MALLTPVLVVMVFWAFQTVTLVTDRVTAGHAVRQGARLGGQLCGSQVSPGLTQAQIDGDIVQNVLAVTRTLSYASVLEIDIYKVTAADGTLQTTDLQDQFDGSGNPLVTQTFTVGQRVSSPPTETSVGVRLYWRYQPPTGYQFTSLNISDRAVMKCQPILT
jgi:Flp pilus assembly protein TadG